MKIGILSDTHDDIDNVNKAIDIFQENDVKAVIPVSYTHLTLPTILLV